MSELAILTIAIALLSIIASSIYERGFEAGKEKGERLYGHPTEPVSRWGEGDLEAFTAAARALGYEDVSVQTREFEDGRACWFVEEENLRPGGGGESNE